MNWVVVQTSYNGDNGHDFIEGSDKVFGPMTEKQAKEFAKEKNAEKGNGLRGYLFFTASELTNLE